MLIQISAYGRADESTEKLHAAIDTNCGPFCPNRRNLGNERRQSRFQQIEGNGESLAVLLGVDAGVGRRGVHKGNHGVAQAFGHAEDAQRLARWLYGRPLGPATGSPEQRVDLPQPVPVYITYLTLVPEGAELASYPDVYGRDRDQLAGLGGMPTAAAR